MINKEYISRFLANPFGFIKRVLYKFTYGPLKYSKGNDYKASEYWDDRFSKYDKNLMGPGDEALNESGNLDMYELCKKRFLNLCDVHKLDFKESKLLEIGIGNGFYTNILKEKGLEDYQGADISDVLFESLRKKYSPYSFLKIDVTTQKLTGTYDIVLLIDVIQHIVNEEKLEFAFKNIREVVAPGGYFVLTPILNMNKKQFFYLKSWSLQTIMANFKGFIFIDIVPFKESHMILLQKPYEGQKQ